jgi:hypothetical protein
VLPAREEVSNPEHEIIEIKKKMEKTLYSEIQSLLEEQSKSSTNSVSQLISQLHGVYKTDNIDSWGGLSRDMVYEKDNPVICDQNTLLGSDNFKLTVMVEGKKDESLCFGPEEAWISFCEYPLRKSGVFFSSGKVVNAEGTEITPPKWWSAIHVESDSKKPLNIVIEQTKEENLACKRNYNLFLVSKITIDFGKVKKEVNTIALDGDEIMFFTSAYKTENGYFHLEDGEHVSLSLNEERYESWGKYEFYELLSTELEQAKKAMLSKVETWELISSLSAVLKMRGMNMEDVENISLSPDKDTNEWIVSVKMKNGEIFEYLP